MDYTLIETDVFGDVFNLIVKGETWGRITYDNYNESWRISTDNYIKEFATQKEAAEALYFYYVNKCIVSITN